MRKFCAGLLFVCTMVAVSAGTASANAVPREMLTVGISQYPASLHPNTEASVAQSYILGMAHRPFTVFDRNWALICLLCTELPNAENGTLVEETRADGSRGIAATFTIRAQARWGDGTPVTTRDVRFTWEVGRDPRAGFIAHELFARDIIDITTHDDHRFTLHFRPEQRCRMEAINEFRLLPAHLEEPLWRADPAAYRHRSLYVTNPTHPGLYHGPFRPVRIERGAMVVLEANPTWWGPAPAFRRIVVKAIENTAALEANLLSGEIDAIAGEAGITLDQALALDKRHGTRFAITYRPSLLYEHVDMNLDNPILRDLRVRQALLLALDRPGLVRQLFADKQPVAHADVHPADPDYATDLSATPHDSTRARQLLDEAGWTLPPGNATGSKSGDKSGGVRRNAAGEPLQLEFVTTAGNRSREMVQQVLQAQWRAVGIDVRIANQPARVLFGETLSRRRFTGLALYAWSSAPESVPRTSLHSSQIPSVENGWSGQNNPGFRHAEVDRILDDLQTTCDAAPRRALRQRLQHLYAEQLPALPLFFRADAFILPRWLKGVEPTGHQYGTSLWVEHWHASE